MTAKTYFGAIAAAGLLVATLPAWAAPAPVLSCGGDSVGSAKVGDVKLGGLAADACDISGVNPSQSKNGNSSGFSGDFGAGGWSLLSKVGGATSSATLDGVHYTIDFSVDSNKLGGTWTVKVDKAVKVDLVFAMHASNHSGAFLFDDQILSAASAGTGGSWTIKWDNNGGNNPGFSNLALFARNQTLAPVPEADTWAMLAAGLGVLGIVARRRNKTAA